MRVLITVHLLLSPLLFFPFTDEAFEFPKELALRGAALGLLGLALARRGGAALFRPAGDPVAWSLLAWLAWGGVAAAFSDSPRTALVGAHRSFDGLAAAGAYTVLYFAARATFREGADLRPVAAAAGCAALGACLWALVQLAGLDPIPWQHEFFFAGRWLRPFSTLGHANHLGAYLATTLPLLALPFLGSAHWSPRARAAAAATAMLAVGILVTTLSRAAWLGAAAGALTLTGLAWRDLRPRARRSLGALALGAALLVAGALVTLPALRDTVALRAATVQNPAREGRLPIWQAAWRMTLDHPVAGVGPDQFALAFGRYRTPHFTARELDRTPTRAHAELLHVAATYGLPGLLAALGVAAGAIANLRRAARRRPTRSEARVVAAALLAFATSVSVGFHGVPTASLAIVLLGVAAGLGGRGAPLPPTRPGLTRALAVGLAAGLLAIPLVALPFGGAFHSWKAHGLLRAGHFGEAEASAQHSLRLARWSPRAWAILAKTHEMGTRFQPDPALRRSGLLSAREAADRAVELEPADAHLRMLRAEILTALAGLEPPGATREAALQEIEVALAREPAYLPYLRAGLEMALALGETGLAGRLDAQRRALYEDAPQRR